MAYEWSTAGTEVRITEGNDFPVIPEPGETVQIVYTDAVTEVSTDSTDPASRVALSCTKSLTVDTPYKTSYPQSRVSAWATISSGCSRGDTITLGLYDGWYMISSNSWSAVNNGSTFGSGTSGPCNSTASTPYKGIAAWGTGGSVTGPTANLSCRY
ncbi:hypothetical protein GCM10017690_21260 [Microbacterium terregens]